MREFIIFFLWSKIIIQESKIYNTVIYSNLFVKKTNGSHVYPQKKSKKSVKKASMSQSFWVTIIQS